MEQTTLRREMTKLLQKETICNDCTLCENIKSRVRSRQLVGTALYRKKGILFVGNFPTKEDDLQEYSFSSIQGKLLHYLLDQSIIDKEEVYLTNAVLCTPYASEELTTLVNPNKASIKACSNNLAKVILVLEPRLIFALGKVAEASLKLLKKNYIPMKSLNEILASGVKQEMESNRFVLTLNKVLDA